MNPFRFEVGDSHFLRDSQPHRILSGALHYFRVLPEYWRDRMQKYAACGLNTVETYLPWNLHELTPGNFDFSGRLDLRKFIQTAGELGLDVIVRPGPYICAEWENGGLPAWLLKDQAMRPRTSYQPFVSATEAYLRRVVEEIGDLQCTRGGPVIAVQIENEYGSFGNDKAYLLALEKTLKDAGLDVMLFTSDDASDYTLQGGTLPHVYKTVNFGSRAAQAFETLRRHQPNGPLMCMEFWLGWFDHWGTHHHVREAHDAAQALDQLLSLGASVNIYMMHGGTNFGFLNGANDNETYAPVTTSYDYDAPLDERGVPTAKYFAIREVLQKHGASPSELPVQAPTATYGAVSFHECRNLFDALNELPPPVRSPFPITMEEAGQNFGYILYRTLLTGPKDLMPLTITDVHDRALVFLDGSFLGIVDRNAPQPLEISVPTSTSQLDILVENLGRVNHGGKRPDRKGVTHSVRLGAQAHAGWEIYPLDFSQLPPLLWQQPSKISAPSFHRGTFDVEDAFDTYLEINGSHGAVWVNGFCLGRYWRIGPQKRLLVPGALLRKGANELVIFEMEDEKRPFAQFFSTPAWTS